MRPAIIYLGHALGAVVVGGVVGLVTPLAFAATDPRADTISPFGIYLGPWVGSHRPRAGVTNPANAIAV